MNNIFCAEVSGAAQQRRPFYLGACLSLTLLVIVLFAALTVGKYPVSLAEIWQVLLAKLTGQESGLPATVERVIWNIRLPRVLVGLAIGAALSAAGAVFQGLFRNPLVSPDLLGVSSGASLGAVAGIFLSLPVLAIQGLAFTGGLLAVGFVYLIGALVRGRDPILVLVLAGVAISAMLGSVISLLKVLADPYNQLPAITFWLLGSLASITWSDAISVLPAMVLGLVPLILLRWRMNLLTLEDDEARSLGIETARLRLILIAGATLLTASAVSIAGIIGWVGLLVPHVTRMFTGPNFSRLLPISMMIGGGFLVGVDALARSIAAIEVPLGILTAGIGAPFFLWLLAGKRKGWQ